MPRKFDYLDKLSRLHHLDLLAQQVVEGFLIGLHRSPFHGFSVEFAEHRLYNAGESTRNIDWKVYARTDRVYVKKYEEETNLRCHLIVDASSSMYFPDEKENQFRKIDFACLASASVMYLLKKQRDAFGLTIFSDKTELSSEVKSSSVHHKLMIGELERLVGREEKNKSTNAAACLHEIADKIHRRSLVILFSDMFENINTAEADAVFAGLQHLKHNRHEVILFHVADYAKELEFDYANRPYRFVDLESGDQVKLKPNQVKDYYKTQMNDFFRKLKLRCGQYHIDFVEADINKDFDQILLPYLMKRQKFN